MSRLLRFISITVASITFTSWLAIASAQSVPVSVWKDNFSPIQNYAPYLPAEMGVKFQVNQPGQIQGIRFFKGNGNNGIHTGHLWDLQGNLLATVVFTNESDFGWQTALFPQAVSVQPNVTYVVSYYSPTGAFSADLGYLYTAYSNGPITLLGDGDSGGNGVYTFAPLGSFPNQTYEAANYWVDVVFLPGATTPPPSPGPGPSPGPDSGPIHACMLNQNGVRYQAIYVTGVSGTHTLDSQLFFGPSCDPNQLADHVFFGQPVPFYGNSLYWLIHFGNQPNTSAIWTLDNVTTPCIDYSKVPDCP